MKAKPIKIVDGEQVVCDPAEAQYLILRLPGPSGLICLPVMIKGTREGTRNWTWNGSIESPTLKPSVLLTRPESRCHSFINDGHVQFLDDCTHDFKGKTLELLNIQ
jgi:hypothetical protein